MASLAWTPTGGREPLLMNLGQVGCGFRNSSNGRHHISAFDGRHSWLEHPYPKFLETTLPRLRCCVAVTLPSPTVCSVSLNRKWPYTAPVCQVFEHV